MKKLLCSLLAFVISVVFCACDNVGKAFTVTSFTSEVQLTRDEKITEGTFVFENGNSMYIEFSADDDLGGVKVYYENGEYRYVYDGVTVTADAESEKESVCGLFSAMVLLADAGAEITTGEENVFCLSDDSNEYTYTVSADGVNLMSISSIQGNITFRYKY